MIQYRDERTMIRHNLEEGTMKKYVILLHSPNDGGALELDHCLSALSIRQETAPTLEQVPLVVTLLLLPERVTKTMKDGRISLKVKWSAELKVSQDGR